MPKDVLAKNFQANMSAFNDLPGKELYIFPSSASTVMSHLLRFCSSRLTQRQ